MPGKEIDLNNQRVLVIRPDNIGDLVCTTPLFALLRKHYPKMQLDVFVNSYNGPILDDQPDIDGYYYYTKAKHRINQSLLSVYWQRFKTLMYLRRQRYDFAILAGVGFQWKGLRFARQLGIKNIIGYCPKDHLRAKDFSHPVYYEAKDLHGHEVEMVCDLLKPLGITDKPGPLRLAANPQAVQAQQAKLADHFHAGESLIGVHISSRKPENRWPEADYIALIQQLWDTYHEPILLFWSPGDESNPTHPGDDQKAQRIQAAVPEVTLIPCQAHTLCELVAAMSLCRSMICADGGAMHVAAALVEYMVVVFGKTNPEQWHPWGVEHHLLKAPDEHAADITVAQMLRAFADLHDRHE